MQQGDYVASEITALASGKSFDQPFRYRDRGSMAVIGRFSCGGTDWQSTLHWRTCMVHLGGDSLDGDHLILEPTAGDDSVGRDVLISSSFRV